MQGCFFLTEDNNKATQCPLTSFQRYGRFRSQTYKQLRYQHMNKRYAEITSFLSPINSQVSLIYHSNLSTPASVLSRHFRTSKSIFVAQSSPKLVALTEGAVFLK